MADGKIWHKDFVLITGINFLIYLIFYLMTIIIAEYAMDSLQCSVGEAGLAAGIFVFSGFCGRMLAGRLSADGRLKRLLLLGAAWYMAAALCYSGVQSTFMLYAVRILHGIGFGIVSTAASAISALVLPRERRSEGIGYFALSMTLATAAGPFWGMKLQAGGYGEIFFVSSVLSIIVLLACWWVKVPDLEAVADSRNGSRYFERRAVPLGVIGFFMGMSYSGIISFFSVYAKSISLEGAGQYFFLLYAVIILLSRPVLGRQIDSHTKGVMLGIFICFALGMGMLGAADSAVILLGSAVMTGLGYGSFIPAVQAILVRSMEPQHIAVAIATFLALLDIGMGLGAYILGALVSVLGYRMLYALLTVVILGCMGSYLILQGKQSECSWHRV